MRLELSRAGLSRLLSQPVDLLVGRFGQPLRQTLHRLLPFIAFPHSSLLVPRAA
jgi:hypothetical protein